MDLQADIKWIQKEVEKVKEPKVLETIKSLLKQRPKNNVLGEPMSLEEYGNDIKKSLRDIEAGRTKSHEDIKAKYQKWLDE